MLPARVVDLHVTRMEPDDYRVSFELESGEVIDICGRDAYDPPCPFDGVFDIWAFATLQSPPMDLLVRELEALDPHWETVIEQRRPRGDLDARREEDRAHRERLREEFRRQRKQPT